MSIRSALLRLLSLAAAMMASASPSYSSDLRPPRSEELTLASLDAAPRLRLDEDQALVRIDFDLAPGARAEAVELILVARPKSDASGGRISVSINRGRAVVLAPRAESFEARFALYSDAIRPGTNTLNLVFEAAAEDGWILDAEASRLRVSAAPAAGYDSLSDIEAALASDYATPRRIHVDAREAGVQETAVAALTAQGLALRLGEAPILVNEPSVAELTVRAVADPAAVTPAIVMTGPSEIQLSATDSSALIAAARLFAARSMVGQERRFGAAQALSAPRLVFGDAATAPASADLAHLAALGAPFGAEQGSRTAVVIAAADAESRAGALAVVGRAALASGSAWIYGWFGDDVRLAPANHNLLVLGPMDTMDARLIEAAPSEVRAATDAARARTPRDSHYFGSTAFAAEDAPALGDVTGIAAIFDDRSGRTVALITAPEGADFARAAKRLARSSLWDGMEGRAVLWDAAAVTAFGPSTGPAFSREAVTVFLRRNDRWVALGAFSLAVLLLITGGAVNRTASRRV